MVEPSEDKIRTVATWLLRNVTGVVDRAGATEIAKDLLTECDLAPVASEPAAAVLDFVAWLTTQPGTLLVGSAHSSPAVLEAAHRFLDGLSPVASDVAEDDEEQLRADQELREYRTATGEELT